MKKYSCYYILSESTNLVDVALTFVNGELRLLFWLLGSETVVEGGVGGLGRCLLDENLLGSSGLLGNTNGCGSLVSEVGKRVGEGFELGVGGGVWLSYRSEPFDRSDGGDDEKSDLRLGEHCFAFVCFENLSN
mmetsp:Transcript_33427/g.48716  ORF Transcript_33427/g.48716 Transcript_33427/m.48716 type:complete len:133 (+) Transcript_33427:18-416(+)